MCWCADVQTSHAEIADSSAPVSHAGAAPFRYRCTLPGPLLPLRGQDLRHRQGRPPLHGDGVLILHPLVGRAPGAEIVPILPLFSVATTSRRTPLLLASSVRLKKSLHNPGGPLIFVVDSVLPGASNLAPLGRQAQDVKLVADPSEGSHHPVQLFLVLRAVPPRPSVLTQGLNAWPAKLVTCVAW
jgi:hypothetical protein